MDFFLGIDIGTTGCKSVVFDATGVQVSLAYREYDTISENPGWVELDTDEVINKCFEVIKESASVIPAGSLKSIGISSQGEAFTMIDKSGKALCNAFVSSDSRADIYVRRRTAGFNDKELYNITGHTSHPMFSLFKLLWVKDNMADVWQRCFRILCFEDLLQYRLGIKNPAISWSLAGRTMLFDVRVHRWSEEILEKAGIRKELLSEPVPSGRIAGYVDDVITRQLNLKGKIAVATAGHDQPCSALGAGAVKPGVAVYASGTVECITPAFEKPVFSEKLRKYNFCTYDHAAEGLYATLAFSLTGGNLLKWFRDEFGQREKEIARLNNGDPYKLLLEQMPPGPSRLLVLPYFTPSGTPYFDTSVRGTVMGLDLSTSRGEILKALIEGVALEIKLNLEMLEQAGYKVNELRAIGGGAKSDLLIRLKSDIINKPITTPDITEAGCRGAAILARSAYEKTDINEIIDRWVKPGAVILPRGNDLYHEKFQKYKSLYAKLKRDFYQDLDG
jgi:xylulokinase